METRRPPAQAPQPAPRDRAGSRAVGFPALELDPSALLPLVEELSDGLYSIDAEGRIVSWSAGAERLTGHSPAEAHGRPLAMLLAGERCGVERVLEFVRQPGGREALRWQEYLVQARDGRMLALVGSVRLVHDENGRIAGALGTLSDLVSFTLGPGATRMDGPIDPRDELDGLVGRGAAMQDVFRRLRLAAAHDLPVLLRGEPGTGRSHAARLVHELSARGARALQVVECAARCEGELAGELFGEREGAGGKIRASIGGTLLLEEVQELSETVQERLLEFAERALAGRGLGQPGAAPEDVRVIATAGEDLDRRVERGAFLGRLRSALKGQDIQLPPLRERRVDLPLIVRRQVAELARARRQVVREISREALETLLQHPWPDNVRQLRDALAHALESLQGDRIELAHLPCDVRTAFDGPSGPAGVERVWTGSERLERARLVEALERNHWNRTRTARFLGISRVTLWKRIRRWGLEGPPEGVPEREA